MEKRVNDHELDEKIARTHEEIQLEKKEQLIKLIVEVVVEATLKEYYEIKEREENPL